MKATADKEGSAAAEEEGSAAAEEEGSAAAETEGSAAAAAAAELKNGAQEGSDSLGRGRAGTVLIHLIDAVLINLVARHVLALTKLIDDRFNACVARELFTR